MNAHSIVVSECSTLTSKGQVTIPASVRDALNLHQGDRIQFELDAEGVFRIRPLRNSHHQVAGLLSTLVSKSYSEESLRETMARHLGGKFAP
jgi:AbrB family looped-hinge helix DNA binding protein